MKRTVTTALLALMLASLALGAAQQVSVRAGLEARQALGAWKAMTGIIPIPDLKLERTQLYSVGLKMKDSSTELGLMLGANGKNAFAHYVSIIYGGPATREAGVAHGYLTSLVAQDCMGLDSATLTKVRGLMSDVVGRLKNDRVSRTAREGSLRAEAFAEFKRNRLSVVMTLERTDAPGATWPTYCGFEK